MNEIKNNYTLKWTEFKNLSDVPKVAGIYLYTLNDFNNFPFYIGTAGERSGSSLYTRLAANERLFRSGKRTFLRPDFFLDYKDNSIEIAWSKATENTDCLEKYFYIPDVVKSDIGSIKNESIDFWNKRINKFYIELEHLKGYRDSLRCIEAKLQDHIRQKFPKIKLTTPHVKFQYLGQTNISDLLESKKIEIKLSGVSWFSDL